MPKTRRDYGLIDNPEMDYSAPSSHIGSTTKLSELMHQACATVCVPARSFVAYIVANIGGESVGDWAACEQCHRLIEAGDRAGLMERSLVTLMAEHPEMEPARNELMEHMTSLHVMFFENRTGMALRIV